MYHVKCVCAYAKSVNVSGVTVLFNKIITTKIENNQKDKKNFSGARTRCIKLRENSRKDDEQSEIYGQNVVKDVKTMTYIMLIKSINLRHHAYTLINAMYSVSIIRNTKTK